MISKDDDVYSTVYSNSTFGSIHSRIGLIQVYQKKVHTRFMEALCKTEGNQENKTNVPYQQNHTYTHKSMVSSYHEVLYISE